MTKKNDNIDGLISMSELARKADVNVESIRFYLKKNLLIAPKGVRGINKFSLDYVEQLKFIKSAQKVGFSLAEIKEILDLKMTKKNDCTSIKRITEKKVLEISDKIENLKSILKLLKNFERNCNGKEGMDHCSILDNLKGLKK